MAGWAEVAATPRRAVWMLPLQLSITIAVLLLAAAPPARGLMLVVPVGGSATPALTVGARFVASGPLPGSLIVHGDRATLVPHLLRHGAIVLAGRAPSCAGGRA